MHKKATIHDPSRTQWHIIVKNLDSHTTHKNECQRQLKIAVEVKRVHDVEINYLTEKNQWPAVDQFCKKCRKVGH